MKWYEKMILGSGSKIQDFSRIIRDFGHWVGTIALGLRARRFFKEERRLKKAIDEQLPPWHDNFATKEGEHDHV